MAQDWHQIVTLLTIDRPWIRVGLALDQQQILACSTLNWHRFDTAFASDWDWIDEDWHWMSADWLCRVGVAFHEIGMDVNRIDTGFSLDGDRLALD